MKTKNLNNSAFSKEDKAERIIEGLFSPNVPPALENDIRRWLAASEDRHEKDSALAIIFDKLVRGATKASRSTLDSLKKVKKTMGQPAADYHCPADGEIVIPKFRGPEKSAKLHRLTALQVAAATLPIAVIFGISLYIVRSPRRTTDMLAVAATVEMTVVTAPDNEALRVDMPDGSVIVLAAGSQIRYPSTYPEPRNVMLAGTADFSVQSIDTLEQFTARTEKLEVMVHGTEFNVDETTTKDCTVVTLDRGSVEVLVDDESRMLAPGQRLIFNHSTNDIAIVRTTASPPSFAGNLGGILRFNSIPMKEILNDVESYFKVSIKRNGYDSYDKYSLSLSRHYNISAVMEMLQQLAGDFDYTIAGKVITIIPRNGAATDESLIIEDGQMKRYADFEARERDSTIVSKIYTGPLNRTQPDVEYILPGKVSPAGIPSGFGIIPANERTKLLLKSNILYAGTALAPNLHFEIGLGRKTSLDMGLGYNGWGSKNDKRKSDHTLAIAELRYWTGERFNGHFFGLHLLGGTFDIKGHHIPGAFERGGRYDGNGFGAGLSYGYMLPLSKRWSAEFNAGLGVIRLTGDKYTTETVSVPGECAVNFATVRPQCENSGTREVLTKSKYSDTYFGPTRLGITLVYTLK